MGDDAHNQQDDERQLRPVDEERQEGQPEHKETHIFVKLRIAGRERLPVYEQQPVLPLEAVQQVTGSARLVSGVHIIPRGACIGSRRWDGWIV